MRPYLPVECSIDCRFDYSEKSRFTAEFRIKYTHKNAIVV
jgi:hypothetical protein